MTHKDIRYSQKKVDESWKDQAAPKPSKADVDTPKTAGPQHEKKTSKPFVNLLHSLAYQGFIHLGEAENPATQKKEPDMEAAREIIDLLIALKERTAGNTSPEESEIFSSLLSDLQLKFAHQA